MLLAYQHIRKYRYCKNRTNILSFLRVYFSQIFELCLKNFYLTGSDLAGIGLTGDLQSGVVTANAVLGTLKISYSSYLHIIINCAFDYNERIHCGRAW